KSAGTPCGSYLPWWPESVSAGRATRRLRFSSRTGSLRGIWRLLPPSIVWQRNGASAGRCLFGRRARTTGQAAALVRLFYLRNFERNSTMKAVRDHLRKGMKLVIVGCNPTESSVRTGHYYSGRGNPFWPVLYETGVIPEPLEYRDDKRIIEFAIGLTDLVKRPTRSLMELTREDFAEGRIVLSQKLGEFMPHVIAFNGKNVFEQFAQRRAKLGLQKELLYGARVYVLPATASQHAQKNGERTQHFRKLSALVKTVQNSPDSKPLSFSP